MTHTVTITRLPNEESDDYVYEFGGSCGFDCLTLERCHRKACQAMNPDYEPGDERFRHGKEHYFRDGEWLAESATCALRYVFENVTSSEYFDGAALGTYPIRLQWEDDVWWFEFDQTTPTQSVIAEEVVDVQGNRLAVNDAERCTVAMGEAGDDSRRCERLAHPIHNTHLVDGVYHLPTNNVEVLIEGHRDCCGWMPDHSGDGDGG